MNDSSRTSERRLHTRYIVEGPLSLGPGGQNAVLRDISMSGLSCLSPRAFDEMAVLEIAIALPHSDGRRVDFKASGAVVRCEPTDDGAHQLGVFFTFVDTKNTQVLETFIRDQAR